MFNIGRKIKAKDKKEAIKKAKKELTKELGRDVTKKQIKCKKIGKGKFDCGTKLKTKELRELTKIFRKAYKK